MPGGSARGAVPAVVVLAVLSTVSGIVTTLAGQGTEKPPEMERYLVPRDELERRLGQLELRLSVKMADLRELIIRRTSK
jgi:hypothetical protein